MVAKLATQHKVNYKDNVTLPVRMRELVGSRAF